MEMLPDRRGEIFSPVFLFSNFLYEYSISCRKAIFKTNHKIVKTPSEKNDMLLLHRDGKQVST